ncbi:MAG: hypothetical protein ACPGGK_15400, partial [Pikeienuella sp.]
SVVVMTSCYSDPEDRETYEAYEGALKASDAVIHPVYLYCSEAEMLRRVGAEERSAQGKISTKSGLLAYVAANNFVPVPRDACIRMETARPAEDVACQLVAQLGLGAG